MPPPHSRAGARAATPLVRRSRYLIALLLLLAAFGVYLVLEQRQRAGNPSAETCAALPAAIAGALETQDCDLLHRNLTQALATAEGGTVTRWTNLKTGTAGTITLGVTEMRGAGACRRADMALMPRSGETRRGAIVACLKDGKWSLAPL